MWTSRMILCHTAESAQSSMPLSSGDRRFYLADSYTTMQSPQSVATPGDEFTQDDVAIKSAEAGSDNAGKTSSDDRAIHHVRV